MTLDVKAVDRSVQDALCDERYEKDVKLATAMFMELARAVESQLTIAQLEGLAVAKRYWQGQATEAERLQYLEVLGKQQGAIDGSGRALSAESARNRLVWASLNAREGLSSFMGDFLVGEAKQAGISMDLVDAAFAKIVPSYRSSR